MATLAEAAIPARSAIALEPAQREPWPRPDEQHAGACQSQASDPLEVRARGTGPHRQACHDEEETERNPECDESEGTPSPDPLGQHEHQLDPPPTTDHRLHTLRCSRRVKGRKTGCASQWRRRPPIDPSSKPGRPTHRRTGPSLVIAACALAHAVEALEGRAQHGLVALRQLVVGQDRSPQRPGPGGEVPGRWSGVRHGRKAPVAAWWHRKSA